EALPDGLVESARLDSPIFSPATKADTGHDENITFSQMQGIVGRDRAERLRTASLALYTAGRDRAAQNGLIIADTKFEFGTLPDGTLLLIDELLTPDSSRFWPADRYAAGRGQPSFDKQPLRDFLAGQQRAGVWDGDAPAPALPAEIVNATSVRYRDAYQRVTGDALPTYG
ncbi:MAG: phosphoribosylaminoimidazolesuccinocarboxamide synthase, partial [Gemmatimonadales bacterium]